MIGWIISLIMHGISSTSISLLWNGSKTPNFSPVCGLRQGDPLSPYLFVLWMERLGGMIDAAVRDRNWLPLHQTKDGPRLSPLFLRMTCYSSPKQSLPRPALWLTFSMIFAQFQAWRLVWRSCGHLLLKVSLGLARISFKASRRFASWTALIST